MDKATLKVIETSLCNVAASFTERHRQEGQGAEPPFSFFDEALAQEVKRLRVAGQDTLADAVALVRREVLAMDEN